MCIDDGVRVWVEPWGANFQLNRGPHTTIARTNWFNLLTTEW